MKQDELTLTAAERALCAIPPVPQAQYSTAEQLTVLIKAANRLGLYDAADALMSMIVQRKKP